ncbi:MAG: protease modulator HflC [Planctomycetota bacterium]|jgi:membrane protease subunit HflC
MKNVAIPILIGVIFIIMAVYLVSFQVRETESVLVTRFGKPVRDKTEPGLGWKWPAPIERVHRFDSRLRVLESELVATATNEAEAILIKSFVVWRVDEPLKFLNAVETEADAEEKLRSRISDTQGRVIGQYTFGEFVNSDPDKIKFDEIQAEMLADLQEPVRQDYGIEIKTLGIKQFKVSEKVTKDVFERMKADRQRRTEATIAQGNAEATRIRTDAQAKKTALLAAAEGRAKAIRGQGDAEAAQYLELLEAAPDLAIFLRDLEALEKTLKDRATVIIPGDVAPFKYLREMPSLEVPK